MDKIIHALIIALLGPFYAVLVTAVYPLFTVYVFLIPIMVSLLFPIFAVALVYLWDVSALDVVKHFVVTPLFMIPSYSLVRAGVISPIPGIAPVLIYRTLLWLVPVVAAYYVVFELDLLDRDGPLGERLGLTEASE